VDSIHLLGNTTIPSYANSFSFFFTMQPSYAGTHKIIAYGQYAPHPEYSATFTLTSTNPLDQRLVDVINNGINNGINKIYTYLTGTITTDLNTISSGVSAIYTYLTGTIKPELNQINTTLSGLEPWMTANIKSTALVVQTSQVTQWYGTMNSTNITIEVSRADNGQAVSTAEIGVYFVYDSCRTTSFNGNYWFVGPVVEVGTGTYNVLVTPGSFTTVDGESATFSIYAYASIAGRGYNGCTLATVSCTDSET
jgi:hypothetical protein